MPTPIEENYGLLQGQNDVESKENLHDYHGPKLEPGTSLLHLFRVHRLRVPTKTRDLVMLSLIMSGTVNFILAALLTRTFFYPSSQAQTEIHTVSSDISLYGKTLPAARTV